MNDDPAAPGPEVPAAPTDPAAFLEQLETIFRVRPAADAIPLRLVTVTDPRVSGGLRQFSIYFHGPGDRALPQGLYQLEHDALGLFSLFIVPVLGSNHDRIVYEACFSGPAART